MSACLCFCLYVCLSLFLSVCLFVSVSVVCLFVSVYVVCLFVSVSVCMFVFASIDNILAFILLATFCLLLLYKRPLDYSCLVTWVLRIVIFAIRIPHLKQSYNPDPDQTYRKKNPNVDPQFHFISGSGLWTINIKRIHASDPFRESKI